MAELADYSGKKVAIAGYGAEGRSALHYFRSSGADVTIVDEAESIQDPPGGVATILGPDALKSLDQFDIISRTPPLRPDRLPQGPKVTSVTIEFFERCPAPIIGVTGTKGKGTTATLISEILRRADKTVHLVGNIGVPALDILSEIAPEDVVCYEISSFQLWDLRKSPQVAVVLMVEEDHLDVHQSVEEYIDAKTNIVRYQQPQDLVITHPNNHFSQQIASEARAEKVSFMTEQGAFIRGDDIYIDEQKICSVNEVGLLGKHNLENICAAITAAWKYTQDVVAIAEAVKNFKGLEHRLEFVSEINRIKYYNDSFSASPVAAIAATETFGDSGVMIYGGNDKGIDYCEIARSAQSAGIKQAILIGDIADKLSECFSNAGFDRFQIVRGDINDIVREATSVASPGDSIVLSPGSASFDMFDNYKERGRLFKEAVGALQ